MRCAVSRQGSLAIALPGPYLNPDRAANGYFRRPMNSASSQVAMNANIRYAVLTILAVAVAAISGACDSRRDVTGRADSARAAVAAEARTDSLEAIALVTVDTAIASSLKIDLAKMRKTASGLYTLERRAGSGAAADSNKWIMVDYTTWLTDGTVLDDTRKPGGTPRKVLLGHQQVVAAWDEGLRGMREGARRIIVAPPSLAYGIAGKPGSVPRLSTLVFDIELKRVY